MSLNTPEPVARTKGQRTANRIMDIAEDLFAAHGYDGTSLRQIAEKADIAQPGLYNHFSSKEALRGGLISSAEPNDAGLVESHKRCVNTQRIRRPTRYYYRHTARTPSNGGIVPAGHARRQCVCR